MDYRSALILLALPFASANAAYVYPTAPVGFGGSPGNWTYAPKSGAQILDDILGPSKGSTILDNIIREGKHLPVNTGSGAKVALPVAYKIGNAGYKAAAAAVFLNPYVRTAAGVATWLGLAGLAWDVANQVWKKPDQSATQSTGVQYSYAVSPYVWRNSFAEACAQGAAKESKNGWAYSVTGTSGGTCSVSAKYMQDPPVEGALTIIERASSCRAGWWIVASGCQQNRPVKTVDQVEFEDDLSKKKMPPTVPAELPYPTPLPIDGDPIVNPTPGNDPRPSPYFVPTGDPVPNPKYDPNSAPGPDNEPFAQPGTKLTPSPTPTEPWRIDATPVDRPKPTKDPSPVPDGEPIQTPTPGDDGDGDKPNEEETQSLCEKHPDILACQVLDEPPEPPKLKEKAVEFEMTPESGFAGSAVCPPPIVVNVSGLTLSFSWQPFCDSLSLLKPLLLAFAWLSAAFIMLGTRSD